MKLRYGLAAVVLTVGLALAGFSGAAVAAPGSNQTDSVVLIGTGAFAGQVQTFTTKRSGTARAAAAAGEATQCFVGGDSPNTYQVPELNRIPGEDITQHRYTGSVNCNGTVQLRMRVGISIFLAVGEVVAGQSPPAGQPPLATPGPGTQLVTTASTHDPLCVSGRFGGLIAVEGDFSGVGTVRANFRSAFNPILGC